MAILVGILCPVTGTLLVTQRRVLQANLISHAVLPGLTISVAFGLDPALGEVSGILGSLLAERLQRHSKLNEEAVMNTVLAGFLGLGVLLIPLLSLRLDLEALLFGDLLTVGWPTWLYVMFAFLTELASLQSLSRTCVFGG